MLGELAYDVRHALRTLRRDRTFTAVALLSIALGVGANAAIFSLVDQALFRLLPVKDPERLVLLDWKGTFIGNGWGSGNLLTHPLYKDLKAENQVFEGMFGRAPSEVYLSTGGESVTVPIEIVTGSYFSVLGIKPALGRLIEESDDITPDAHPVVVLSYDYWKNHMGQARDAVGRKVLINNNPMTVIGVAQAGFRGVDFGETPALWVPTMMKRKASDFDYLLDRRGRWLHVFGRLKPGITREQAFAGLQPWFKAMLEADTKREGWPQVSDDIAKAYFASVLDVLPAASGRSDLRKKLESPLVILLAATGLVLLLACLNVAGLCLARAFARRKETALRVALGAGRSRVVRELLIQSTLLSVGGALLGVLFAPSVMDGLISFLPENVSLSSEVNLRVMGFALLAAVGTGILFSIAPALQASRTDPGLALKEESRSASGRIGLRKVLVTAQIALAMILLVSAGLFVRTLSGLRAKGTGFDTTNLLSFRVDPMRSGYTKERAAIMMKNLLDRIRALPEVDGAALSSARLLAGGSWNARLTFQSDRRQVTEGSVHCNAVSPGFFATLRAPIIAGRDFDERDVSSSDGATGRRAAIINESLARRYFGDKSPLGARLGVGFLPGTLADAVIVGVVGTFSYRGLREVDEQAFFPFLESGRTSGGYYVRTKVDSASAMASLRAAVRSIDPALPLKGLETIDDQLDRALTNERLLATLATAFAGVASLLAVIGLYGVIAFVVSQRVREIGIRMALGASRGNALWLILRDTAVMTATGFAVALPVVWGLGRVMQGLLYGVRATDALTIVAAGALLALAAFTASAIPARRAASVNPIEALHHE